MDPSATRRTRHFRPTAESFEERKLLSAGAGPNAALKQILSGPGYAHPERPNTPVLPYGLTASLATFIDPSVKIVNPRHIILNHRTFVAPYAQLNATRGYIKIGINSVIGDNAVLIANPNRLPQPTGITIGNGVVVGLGATIRGNAVIGAFANAALPTAVGANALIDGAVIEPGAIVSDLARVGPGVTVPSGFRVLPGVDVTNNAEARDPALGKVVSVTTADVTAIQRDLSAGAALAQGYTNLYQGQSVTGPTPGTTTTGVFNGNLAAVTGTSQEPGPPTASFEPARLAPQFPAPGGYFTQGLFPFFRARSTGGAVFRTRAAVISHRFGRGNSIRADEGQPIVIGSLAGTGNNVSIHSPIGGNVQIGRNFRADDRAVILGGRQAPTATTIGNDVVVGAGAVVYRSTLGDNVSIGAHSYVADSTLPSGTVIPPASIVIGGNVVGRVQW